MINTNEVSQNEMDIDTLTLFDYVTYGITNIQYDYTISSDIELNFD